MLRRLGRGTAQRAVSIAACSRLSSARSFGRMAETQTYQLPSQDMDTEQIMLKSLGCGLGRWNALERHAQSLRDAGVGTCSVRSYLPSPARLIVEAARELRADVIVMSTQRCECGHRLQRGLGVAGGGTSRRSVLGSGDLGPRPSRCCDHPRDELSRRVPGGRERTRRR